ncbi:hypothetical protein Mapa_005954 [Marchantia paleacea]|nr:hypothetical protein Mapa_005954 [Marchantia paleacea]
MDSRMLLVMLVLGLCLTWTKPASAEVYKVDQCERKNFHFSKLRQPCDEFISSSFANGSAKAKCCDVLKMLHNAMLGHVQCYCQLAPSGTEVFADIAAKCKLQRNLQTCHG